ncbi:hypothetical protein PTTW11_05634 [Pyrenophora teres f. teres]|uniref:Uncharacterized protein n=1 Tax=Pyrenophora teres f. teres TaxID=97479 RepID=A0A6S6W2H0_9PLEO|nr:hypothetical protein PTTW11_05634 [Pyrenophora teres f. teres]
MIDKPETPKKVPETKPPVKKPPHIWMMEDTIGPPIATIESLFLFRYDWQPSGSISVPGFLPKWAPRKLPIILQADSSDQKPKPNTIYFPRNSLEPAFEALSIMNPAIDILANSKSLVKLLHFSSSRELQPFAMSLDMIN